ncbi:MAG: LysR family transcriptional regulator [Myxococcales bacterium]|nr:MAG: LysR family transcriptional regulator [Myxococcales bacterium]
MKVVPDPLFDDLASLLCFAQVVETGSFTRAAERLGLAKSVVSKRVSLLEERIGEPLLLRTTRRVTVTTAGARVYPHARSMAEQGAQATAGATSSAAQRTIRVSAPVTLSQMWLAEPLRDFLTARPQARLELLLSDRLVDLVEERLDLALRITKLKDSGLVARRLASTPIDVCGSPRYFAEHGRPRTPEDLARHNCLRYALLRPDHEWRLYRDARRIELGLHGNLETTNGTMLREAAIEGLGLAILPRFMTLEALEDGRLERVLEDFSPPPIGIYAVRASRRGPSTAVAELVRALETSLRRQPWALKAR